MSVELVSASEVKGASRSVGTLARIGESSKGKSSACHAGGRPAVGGKSRRPRQEQSVLEDSSFRLSCQEAKVLAELLAVALAHSLESCQTR